ncbi:hypothetical protein V8E52_004863 [Russula decolorans]
MSLAGPVRPGRHSFRLRLVVDSSSSTVLYFRDSEFQLLPGRYVVTIQDDTSDVSLATNAGSEQDVNERMITVRAVLWRNNKTTEWHGYLHPRRRSQLHGKERVREHFDMSTLGLVTGGVRYELKRVVQGLIHIYGQARSHPISIDAPRVLGFDKDQSAVVCRRDTRFGNEEEENGREGCVPRSWDSFTPSPAVAMPHPRSTYGLSGGINVITRERRLPYVVNVNRPSLTATWIKGNGLSDSEKIRQPGQVNSVGHCGQAAGFKGLDNTYWASEETQHAER